MTTFSNPSLMYKSINTSLVKVLGVVVVHPAVHMLGSTSVLLMVNDKGTALRSFPRHVPSTVKEL
jgi:hypothetical protein